MAPPSREREPGAHARSGRQRRREEAERARRQTLTLVGGAVAAAVIAAAVLIFLNSREGDDAPSDGDRRAIKAARTEIDTGLARDGRSIGDPSAPITVVEYADYQCPFCTGFGLTGLPKLLDEYVATGQVRLEYSHLVVIDADGPGGESYRAAEAAECARDQGRFWEYHELLVANSLGEYEGSFTVERLKSIAERVDGLDQVAFGACVDGRTHQAAVVQMRADALAAGIRSTPTFTVNGTRVTGGYAQLKEVIDGQLAGA